MLQPVVAPSPPSPAPLAVLPPAQTARRVALILSGIAVAFSLGCGFCGRRAYSLRDAAPDVVLPWVSGFLVLLLVALLLRMGAAVCELLWLERTWSNLPAARRQVGPVKDVNPGVAVVVTLVPGVAWVWKLGLVVGIANGFEALRAEVPFSAPVPRKLGMAAVIVGWVPGLNVYAAPFLWEMFAQRIDACVEQIRAITCAERT